MITSTFLVLFTAVSLLSDKYVLNEWMNVDAAWWDVRAKIWENKETYAVRLSLHPYHPSDTPFWMFFFLIWSFSTTQSGCISSELMLGWTLNLHVFWHHAETNTLIQENYILCGIRRKQLIKYLIISQQNIVIELLTNNGKESLVTQATEDTKT